MRTEWTHEKERIFKQGLREYGKDWDVIKKLLRTENWIYIKEYGKLLLKEIQWNHDHEDVDLLPILESPWVSSRIKSDADKIKEATTSLLDNN